MKSGFFTVVRDKFTRIFKNGKEQSMYFGKPMTGRELELLEEYYESIRKTEKDNEF